MSLEKANISWSAKQLKAIVMNEKANFDHLAQRGYVWEKARKSAFIESMILGYPIPPIFAKRTCDGTEKRVNNIYYILDGKQRLSTVNEYLNDEFELTTLPTVSYMDDDIGEECKCDITGKKFSELPDALQSHLNTVMFNVIYFDNLTKEEERELFKRLNNGKPLSTKSRLLASCKDIEGLLDIGSHKLFDEMLTDKSKENKNQVALVMKSWCMINMDINDVSFESKAFNPILEKAEVSEAEKINMVNVFNLVVDTHTMLVNTKRKKIAKKLYTETHLISLMPYFNKAVESDIGCGMMADWITEFFDADGASVSEVYNEACSGGSAKNVNILSRHNELEDSYNEFFKEDVEQEDIDDDELEDDNEDNIVDENYDEDEKEYKSIIDEILEDMNHDDDEY